jgi:hypothetical protein
MRSARKLHIVADEPPEQSPSEALAELVPQLMELEHGVTVIRQKIDGHRVRLARERGVAFLREEAIRREFGNA